MRDEIVALDLGTRITKAVYLRRKGAEFTLCSYALLDAPVLEVENALSLDAAAEHFKKAVRLLGTTCRRVVLVMGSSGSVLTHVDLPQTSPSDLRKMIKLSPKSYLQQDLSDYVFDCHFKRQVKQGDTSFISRLRRKSKVLVGGAKRRLVEDLRDAAHMAGLFCEEITLGPVGLANAFRMMRDESHPDAVALLDIGAATSTINVVWQGELALTRVVNLGADRFADLMASTAKPDSPGQDDESGTAFDVAQARLQKAIMSFAKEVDASVGFFNSQYEKTVGQLFVSGGSARSQFVVQALESELSLPCEPWNPARNLTLELPEQRAHELEYEAPQLTIAVGAGLGVLREGSLRVNLLAEEQEAADLRRRDPVRRGCWVAGAAVLGMLLWAGEIGWRLWRTDGEVGQLETRLRSLKIDSAQALNNAMLAGEMVNRLVALKAQRTNRFLWAPVLNALQFATVDGIQFYRLQIDRSVVQEAVPSQNPPAATKGGAPAAAASKPLVKEKLVMMIQGKNYGDQQTIDELIETVSRSPYFRERLRAQQPILLRQVQTRQVDPADPRQTFELFTIECLFAERVL